jgi:hypothetical protein
LDASQIARIDSARFSSHRFPGAGPVGGVTREHVREDRYLAELDGAIKFDQQSSMSTFLGSGIGRDGCAAPIPR